MKECQNNAPVPGTLTVTQTKGKCPIGEKTGEACLANNSIPVLSCEGACIRGEIARLAAQYVSKHENFKRGCHGELFTVPNSKIAEWIRQAPKVVCIDGCFLKCHSRVLENMLDPSKLQVFDALSRHNRYSDIFDMDDVPEAERKEVALDVAQWVLQSIREEKEPESCGSCCSAE